MDKNTIHRVQCDNGEIEYHLTRKVVKNVNLTVKPEGIVCVSAHPQVPLAFIEEFIREKQDWVIENLETYKMNKNKHLIEKKYIEGEKHYLLDIPLTLRLVESHEERVLLGGDEIILQVRDQHDVKRKAKILEGWFYERQKETFEEIAREVYSLFKKYKIEYPVIKIRRMKSRWGSCQYEKGVIILNSRLIEKPRKYIKYVLVHEFAHFIQPNHSKEFYKVVESVMPDWKGIVAHDEEKSSSGY